MNIGEAAKKSGLTVKTVRYYDEINLIKPVKIIKRHGNSQFGGSFGHCVGCDIVGVWFYMSLEIHSAALRITTLWQIISKNKKKHANKTR